MNEVPPITPIDRRVAKRLLAGCNRSEIIRTLLRVVYHDPDYQWAQARCLEMCDHDDEEVRAAAVICLGDISWIHSRIDRAKVEPVLKGLLSDPKLSGVTEDALGDMERFAKNWNRSRSRRRPSDSGKK